MAEIFHVFRSCSVFSFSSLSFSACESSCESDSAVSGQIIEILEDGRNWKQSEEIGRNRKKSEENGRK
jgi:hypothetical protein